MNVWIAALLVGALMLIAWLGAGVMGLTGIFGIVVPYISIAAFLFFLVYRIVGWAKSPVPFRITTTCGQQKSLDWIKASYLESPWTGFGVVLRMALEVLTFRTLFRNTKQELKDGPRLVYGSSKYLWLGALAFHYSFLIIFLRHYRFFTEPVPAFVTMLQTMDGLFEVGVPAVLATDAVIVAAVTFLLARRLWDMRLRYISLVADYFPLFLILGIAGTGILMRYFFKTDIIAVKKLTTGLMSFHPIIPDGISVMFYIHLFLVSSLLIYFPWSKLTHMAGIFLSPTRNLANNNRMVRHINPWHSPAKYHTYAEWEEEFKEKLVSSGIELDKE